MNEPKPQPRDIMSETPRCSALHRDSLDSNDLRAWWKLAYELERELTQAQARCAEARRAALEEASKACDAVYTQMCVQEDADIAKRCADAIRALKEPRTR